MARYHYWQYIVDSEGRPLENVNVRFYLADNPAEEAEIFTHPSLGAPTITSEANTRTDGNGFMEFWVGDEFEAYGGYTSAQQFKLSWERAGILLGTINYVDVFPPVLKVDETDNFSSTKDNKNKTVSNELAEKWDSHTDENVVSSEPHNLEPVDTSSTDPAINKLVSNSLMNYILAAITSAGALSIGASAATERNFTVNTWTPSGDIFYTQLDHFIGRKYPLVQVRESSTDLRIIPAKIKSVDINSVQVMVSDNTVSAEITIVG
ncbi:MAG: hypothetical protein ACW99Q_15020 [Candidatus Kariarchaeaceae archaeon]|jgi:hypothetical protein